MKLAQASYCHSYSHHHSAFQPSAISVRASGLFPDGM